MATRPRRRFWRICRIYFRRLRIFIWLLILAIVAASAYVNQIGLPGIIKKPILQKLRARGIDLQFSRMRLRWYQGIVAENVRFGQADQRFSPKLTASEVQVRISHQALKRFEF